MGQNPVCYNYRATLISFRSCLKPLDTLRTLLLTHSVEQIAEEYTSPGMRDSDFPRYLARQRALWEVDNIVGFQFTGRGPTKDVVLGAWRDLDRSEALLELTDNSIDAWMSRRSQYPKHTPPELNIYIDLDEKNEQLQYEDNAGGVPVQKLENLVIPGFSETTALTQTIGSYKTGGKKAIFRLATEARITSRYWNPAGSGDDAHSVHLCERWLSDPTLYEFPYTPLKDPTVLEKGQTRYVLQLRRDPGGTQWFESPDEMAKLVRNIRQTYTLLLVKHPDINIHLNDRVNRLEPDEQLYRFSETHGNKIDIRPQRVVFVVTLEFEGQEHPVEVEVVLGCRTTTGLQDGRSWGIDLYGNDRLFVLYDQETFAQWMPAGNARQLVRGYVNIRGPNVFIPWDTHKRHLNADREIMAILTRHRQVRELFENWKKAFNDIGRAGKGEVTRIIKNPIKTPFDKRSKQLNVTHTDTVDIKPKPRRGDSLPGKVFVPQVRIPKVKKNDSVKVTLTFTHSEASLLAAYYGLSGEDIKPAELAQAIKEDVIRRVGRRRKS